MESNLSQKESLSSWLGINRATLAVLVAIGGLGLSEEIWHNFFGIHFKDLTGNVVDAAFYIAVYALFLNLFEGFGYVLGGMVAHKSGPAAALALSAIPMLAGFGIMLVSSSPWAKVFGALLITNWEPLSVPATFDVVGTELPKNRRTIAFAMQSIQKRLPKVIGPLLGGFLFAFGFWMNLTAALTVLLTAIVIQLFLLKRMKPKAAAAQVPVREVLRTMPPDLRRLLRAEIILRWGDWFVRDFAALYVVGRLLRSPQEYGLLASLSAFCALVSYIPVSKLVDRARSPKPFIGVTFFLFALFPFSLVLLPKTGMPVMLALAIAFILNGLREIGEPARKAMITSGFPNEVRARAVGLYWGMRSFAFFPAPIAAYLLWSRIGPDYTFLIGGTLGMLGTLYFWIMVQCETPAARAETNR